MNAEEIITQFKRYNRSMDDLLVAEVENIYASSSEKERIRIAKITNDSRNEARMPERWVELTITKGSRNEKIALARFTEDVNCKYPKFNNKTLEELFLESNDPLIKAALHENPNYLPIWGMGDEQFKIFKNATFAERFSIVRNANVDFKVLTGIYDPETNPFDLTDEQRVKLVSTFCANEAHLERSRRIGGHTTDSSYQSHEENYQYNQLWDLAMKWLEPSKLGLVPNIACMTFNKFPCESGKMLDVYKKLTKTPSPDKKQMDIYLNARRSIFYMLNDLRLEEQKRRAIKPLLKAALKDEDKDKDPDFGPDYSISGIARFLLDEEDFPKDPSDRVLSWVGKSFAYVWRVIVNLITLAVLFAILSSGGTKFETLTLLMLALIYLSVVSWSSMSMLIQAEKMHVDHKKFKDLRMSLKTQLNEQEVIEDQAYEQAKKKLKANTIKFWINSIFNSIFYCIIIFKILSLTVFGQ